MPNFITNTAIVNESWNGRGLITHNAVTKALIRADNGVLWAAVREGHVKEFINIYRSKDDGFSWENMFAGDFVEVFRRTGLAGLNQNGPFLNLTLSEERQVLILWHTYYDQAGQMYNLEPFIFEITDAGLVRKVDSHVDYGVAGIETDADQLALDVSYTTNHVFLLYASHSALKVKVYDHTYQTSVDGEGGEPGSYFNVFAGHANDDNTLDIAIVCDEGTNFILKYIRFFRLDGTFTAPVNISSFPEADVADVNIERDGSNNLLAFWNQESADGAIITQKYAISKDNGASWTVNDVPFTPFQTNFKDLPTGRLSGRTVALGGLQGFLLGYVRLFHEKPYGYVRTLLVDSDGNYALSDEYMVVDTPITGFRFFRSTNNQLPDLDQIQQVRIAYQEGEATSQIQLDVWPVRFGQQLLRESKAFQYPVKIYGIDVPFEGQLLADFNLLGAVNENIDYYHEGLIGAISKKYINAFNKAGTQVELLRYDPVLAAESDDRSAYRDPVIFPDKIVIQPSSYSFPMSTGTDSFTTMVERDIRRVHIPPYFHLARVFLVNRGNHLKRTVWIVKFDGNEYELSQVVPRFLKNQIAFYDANAYVVGPSNNPFARTILPSET